MRQRICVALASVSMVVASVSLAQEAPKPAATLQLPPAPLLPASLKEWQSLDVAKAPPAPADLSEDLKKEFILKREATQAYQRAGVSMTVHAEQFIDATGAYAAFTARRKPGMQKPASKAGTDIVVDGDEAVFWSGPTLVQVSAHPLDLKALQDLAVGLPKVSGPSGRAPSLPTYFPKGGRQAETERYAVGPLSYLVEGGPFPVDLIDFSKSPEIAMAEYAGPAGNGLVTLIYYPTPQIAGERSRALLSALQKSPPAGTTPESIAVKREGPIVAITTGSFSAEQSSKLLKQIHYETSVTWNKTTGYFSEASKAAKVVVGAILGAFAFAIAAIVLALFFGGGRALWRVARGKPASTVHDSEFIHLNLRQSPPDINPKAG